MKHVGKTSRAHIGDIFVDGDHNVGLCGKRPTHEVCCELPCCGRGQCLRDHNQMDPTNWNYSAVVYITFIMVYFLYSIAWIHVNRVIEVKRCARAATTRCQACVRD